MAKDKAREEFTGFPGNTELQNEFVNATDRAAAIIGASALDAQLEKLLVKYFINDPKEINEFISADNANSPLGTFSAKIRAAYCLGLISINEFKDLQTLRKIRNIFAHNLLDCNFNQERIKSIVDNFIMFNELKDKHPSHEKMEYRLRFTVTVYILDNIIRNRLEIINHKIPFPNIVMG